MKDTIKDFLTRDLYISGKINFCLQCFTERKQRNYFQTKLIKILYIKCVHLKPCFLSHMYDNEEKNTRLNANSTGRYVHKGLHVYQSKYKKFSQK